MNSFIIFAVFLRDPDLDFEDFEFRLGARGQEL
jgi:hypothetical protein